MNKINLHLNMQARIEFGNSKLSSEDTEGNDETAYIPAQNFILEGFYT